MGEEEKKPGTNIEPWMKDAFEALCSGTYGNFALFSCFVNGEPSAAIVAIDHKENETNVMPLFVAVTQDMHLEDHDGNETKELFSEQCINQKGDRGEN